MADNFIIEDFPMSQIEFEKRYNIEQACIDYLAEMKWPDGFVAVIADAGPTGSVQSICSFVPAANLLIY